VDQPGGDGRGEAAEDGGRQAVGQREAGGAQCRRHDFGQRDDHGAVIAGVQERQPQLHGQQAAERRRADQPHHGRVGGQQRHRAEDQQRGTAADAVGQRAHHRQPEQVGGPHAQRDDHAVEFRHVQHVPAEGRRVRGDQVERHRGHHGQQRARTGQAPVLAHRAEDLAQGRAMLALLELLGLAQRAADEEQERHDHAADQERHAPAPFAH